MKTNYSILEVASIGVVCACHLLIKEIKKIGFRHTETRVHSIKSITNNNTYPEPRLIFNYDCGNQACEIIVYMINKNLVDFDVCYAWYYNNDTTCDKHYDGSASINEMLTIAHDCINHTNNGPPDAQTL